MALPGTTTISLVINADGTWLVGTSPGNFEIDQNDNRIATTTGYAVGTWALSGANYRVLTWTATVRGVSNPVFNRL